MRTTKLIILRGPSGSGKSTAAKALREEAHAETALIEQDYLRRVVLKERDVPGGLNSKLILQTVTFCLDNGYNVILEGILGLRHYRDLLKTILVRHPDETYLYYFDIPFEETLKRHATKPNAHEYGETEMRWWYSENDIIDDKREKRISLDLTTTKIVEKIMLETGL